MMKVRKMTASDIFTVAAMEQRMFSDPWSVESFRSALKASNQFFIVAEQDDRIVGFAGMLCVLDEGQILDIAVDESYRRQGIACEMLRELMTYGIMHGLSLYTLEVRESNAPAIKLYRANGFSAVGRRKDYYTKPTEDAVLMEIDMLDPGTAERFQRG